MACFPPATPAARHARLDRPLGTGAARRSALLALGIAVAVAMASLPDYSTLSRRSDLGQMIRVRAADGTLAGLARAELRALARATTRFPATMRSAMIAVEDRRFRSHPGVDPIGVGALVQGALRHRAVEAGRIDDHPAAGAQHLPDQQPHLRAQGQGSRAGARARGQILQGPDPRALPQPRLFRRRRLWHRRRQPDLLRPWRRAAEPERGGDHRRAGQGAVQLFADRRRRGRARPRRGGDQLDGRERLPQRGGGGRAPIPRRSRSSRRPSRTACATSPTGRCPSSTR